MKSKKPYILILPGLFLFILGLGNIGVGEYKAKQYYQVLAELELTAPLSNSLVNSSPMRRIKLAEQSAIRLYQRQKEAKNKIAFYSLVSFGGKSFMLIGMILLLIGIPMRIFNKKELRQAL